MVWDAIQSKGDRELQEVPFFYMNTYANPVIGNFSRFSGDRGQVFLKMLTSAIHSSCNTAYLVTEKGPLCLKMCPKTCEWCLDVLAT